MSIIRPVDMNGMISRSQDVTTFKQNQDNKGIIDQNNFQQEFKKEIQHHMKKVNDPEKGQEEYKYGEKKEGNGAAHSKNYNKKKEDKKEDKKDNKKERVSLKGNSSFDIRI
ncbi:hypothetical protein [Anaerosacchariphilus polymeriproducens]|uniref:hypothetical protein n=1 Tax=Anaerosacchariphilus polymeriproducens TaxID=1812858 RepID=UPI0011C04B15|nr:hypothetical protein [Anaerosacchariphilus polymeriproducens]